MPVDRLLHPRIGDSDKVAKLTDMEFRAWIIYLLAADDFGVLPMTAAKIQGSDRTLGNRRKVQVERAIETMVRTDLVRKFEHQGAWFIYSPTWQTHQRIRYPRKTHYPAPPAEALAQCDRETSAFMRRYHGNVSGISPQDSGSIPEIDPHSARAGACETANGNGLRLTAMATADSDPPQMDVWARELVNLYPAQGRCSWNLVERPLFAALQHDPFPAWERLKTTLEAHKRSHQWRVKQMIPRLDKWLREGLYLQELPEQPVSTQVNDKTVRTLSSGQAFASGGSK